MDTADLIKRVRRIEIKTRRLSDNVLSGEYHSSFKGRGMAFSEVRHYQMGDDIRAIDWNVTARKREPFIKVFEEEREMTLMLLVDVSGSEDFGSSMRHKRELITEVAATLAFSAIQNNDNVGVIFFSDRIEKYIPPRKGRQHTLTIIRELIELQPEGQGTDISKALEYLSGVQKRRTIAMVLSDFRDENYEHALKVAAKRHDLTTMHVSDPAEWDLPSLGVIPIRDPENGETRWVNSSSKRVKRQVHRNAEAAFQRYQKASRSAGAGSVTLQTDGDYVKALLSYFKSAHRQ